MPSPAPTPPLTNKHVLLATHNIDLRTRCSGDDNNNRQPQQQPTVATSSAAVDTTSNDIAAAAAAFVNSKSTSTTTVSNNSSSNSTTVSLPTRMVLSAVSGMGAAIFCHPLDVIRVQMQTSSHFSSTLNAAQTIYKTAGLQNGLYAGISAAFLRQWLYGSCRMGIYSYLLEQQQTRNIREGKSKNDITFATKLGMGCVSGAVGSLVGTPSEVALVRMGADSKLPLAERRNYTGVVNCLQRIRVEEGGVRAWWRGATPTVARATLLSSASMGVTSQAKGELMQSGYFGHDGQWAGGIPLLFCATLISSFCANVVANPFDVVKSRLQNQKVGAPGQPPMYSGMMDCFAKSIKAEGITVLWAGFVPAFVKLAPYSVISLTLVDKLTKAVTGKDAF